MTVISAAMVKELREKTGAGMMDCKGALNETAGDIEAAVDWLRKKGLAKAAKKSGRIAAEGLVAVSIEGLRGVVVEVNSETDFVSKNAQFQELVKTVANVAIAHGDDIEAIKAANAPQGGSIDNAIANAIATIGENMTLRRATQVEVKQGVVASYVHASVSEGLGRIAVLVGLESAGKTDQLATLGRQLAMHIAATNPIALDVTSVSSDVLEREKAILLEKNQGKPANVIEKIVENGLKSYAKDNCLLEQAYIHDGGKTVAQALKEAEGSVGAPIALKAYVRYALGEGIEKSETDFAAEVAAAAGAA